MVVLEVSVELQDIGWNYFLTDLQVCTNKEFIH